MEADNFPHRIKGVSAVILIILIFGLAVGCGSKNKDSANRNDWKMFTSESGGFSVKFPKVPQEKILTEETGAGEIQIHNFMVETDIQTAYGLLYNDCPTNMSLESPKALFDSGEQSALGDKGEIVFQKDLHFNIYPAREFEFRAGGKANYSIRERMILVDRRLYQLITVFLTENPHPDDRATFLESFSLTTKRQGI